MEEARPPGLVSRVWALLTQPSGAWDAIAHEPADPGRLMKRYVAPLAAIPAVCGFVGPLLFGLSLAGVRVRFSIVGRLLEAAAGYALSFAAVWLLAQWIALIAPAFGGARDRGQALKLAAYAPTAVWVAGVVELWPSLAIPALILASLWSLYTLFQGLPKLMRAGEHQSLTFFAAVLLGLLVIVVAAGMLAARAAELGGPLSLA